MLQRLSETADFLKEIRRKSSFAGVWPIARLERLKEQLHSGSGNLTAKLEFGNLAGTDFLKGKVEATLEVTCMRCMQSMTHKVSARFLFGLVISEEAMKALPDNMEPYLVAGEEQSIVAILEDELLLSLPIVSVHEKSCSEYLVEHDKQKQADKEASSPFAVLKNLITD